jgi:hypothetical protein
VADLGTVRLIAQAEIPTVELTILDSRFQFVHSDVGEVDVRLAPGAYLLQYRMGSSVTEIPVVLRPGAESVTVPTPVLSTRSPAPLAGSAACDRYGSFPREQSREVHERLGQGGQLFLFIRRASKDLVVPGSTDSLFDVQLLDANTNVVIDVKRTGRRSSDGTSVGCNVELAPGSYLLRYKSVTSESIEQTVVVSPGWQTLFFASSRRFDAGSDLGPNFPEGAVFIVPSGAGFDPNDRDLMRAESARIALAGSCRVAPEVRLRDVASQVTQIRASVPKGQVDEMLRDKFRSPILGIYGSHLLLLNPAPDWDLLRSIVSALKSLVGNHPDVIALTLRRELNDVTEDGFFELPPMLRNSWTLVVGDSTAQPGLVPADAYAATVAKRLWGSEVWLVWRPPTPQSAAPPPRAERSAAQADADIRDAIPRLYSYVRAQHRSLGAVAFVKQVAANPELTDIQRAILVYLMTMVHQSWTLRGFNRPDGFLAMASAFIQEHLQQYAWADRLTGGLRADPSLESHLDPDRLVRALGVPAAALNQAVVALTNTVTGSSGAAASPTSSSVHP